MKRFAALIPVLAAVGLAVVADDAHSTVNPGISMKAAFTGDAGCLSRFTGYADLINNCGYAVEIAGWLPVATEGWHPTSISLFTNNSWCQSVSTNGVGNGAQVGAVTWVTAGPRSWQTLNLGDRYVWAGLAFRCVLEPGGVVGAYTGT